MMKRKTIQRTLIFRFLFLGIFPVFLIICSIFYFMNHLMINKVTQTKANYVEQASMNMDTCFTYINQSLSSFFSNTDLQSSVRLLNEIPYGSQHTQAATKLSAYLQSMMMAEKEILSVGIYSMNQKLIIAKNDASFNFSSILSSHSEWLDQALTQNGRTAYHGTQLYFDRFWGFCSTILMRDTAAYSSMEPIGFLQILFDEKFFFDIFEQMKTDASGYYILTDPDGNVISSADKNLLGSSIRSKQYFMNLSNKSNGHFRESVDGQDSLVTFYQSKQTGNYLIEITPYSYLTKEWSYIFSIFLILFAGCTIFLVVACLSVATSITKPIQSIRQSMYLFSHGNLSYENTLPSKVPIELQEINESFNEMAVRIQSLFDTTIQQEKKNREIEIRMLQYQINPHFLYNTLSTIALTAMMGNTENVVSMTKALSRLTKNVIGKTGQMIPLRQELMNLTDFIIIMNSRFEGAIHLEIHVEETLQDSLVPNMILQPLVENSIFHGMRKDEANFPIHINASIEEQQLIIEIIDWGIGMQKNEIEKIFSNQNSDDQAAYESLTKIGIHNLDERIRLSFGPQYGLEIFSQYQKGTTVKLRLPIQNLYKE